MISPECPYCGAYAAQTIKKEDGTAIAALDFRRLGSEIQMYCRDCTAIWADRYQVSRRILIKKGNAEPAEKPQHSLCCTICGKHLIETEDGIECPDQDEHNSYAEDFEPANEKED